MLFTIWPTAGDIDNAQIALFDLRTNTRRCLFPEGYFAAESNISRQYDVTADGERFLLIKEKVSTPQRPETLLSCSIGKKS